MTEQEVKRKFPGFGPELIPPGAKEQRLQVYRICRSGKVDAASFLPSHLDPDQNRTKEFDPNDPGSYSVSVFQEEKDANKVLKLLSRHHPAAISSFGTTEPVCGPCQLTTERQRRNGLRSHVDWWVYEDASPHIYFQPVTAD